MSPHAEESLSVLLSVEELQSLLSLLLLLCSERVVDLTFIDFRSEESIAFAISVGVNLCRFSCGCCCFFFVVSFRRFVGRIFWIWACINADFWPSMLRFVVCVGEVDGARFTAGRRLGVVLSCCLS